MQAVPAPSTSSAVVVLVAGAAVVVAALGLNMAQSIVAPVFFAVTLVLAARPLQQRLARRVHPLLASTLTLLALYAILAVLVVAIGVSLVRLVAILPRYSADVARVWTDVLVALSSLGVDTSDLRSVLGGFDASAFVGLARSLLDYLLAASSQVALIVLVMFFLALDLTFVHNRWRQLRAARPVLAGSLADFARRVRRYWVVSTVFGLVVAAFDVVALIWLGVPLAVTWGVLAFVTNYIPNIGFIIGLIPPALLALLEGDVTTMIWVIVLYSVINFTLQSVVQPKFVGDAVGLSATVTLISLVLWSFVVGPLGAILAVPLTLFFQAILIRADPRAHWFNAFLEAEDSPEAREEVLVGDVDHRAVRPLAAHTGTMTESSDRPRLLVLANAAAGSAEDESVRRVLEVLRAGADVRVLVPEGPAELRSALADAPGRRVVVLGGDGSVHAAAAALDDLGLLAERGPVGIVPMGTGNDLARFLDLPQDPVEAAAVVLGGHARDLDLLRDDDGGVVVNVVHAGVGAEATEHSEDAKGVLGAAAYTLGAVRAGLASPGWRVSVSVDDTEVQAPADPVLMVTVGIGATVGGGIPVTPRAVADDAAADVVVVTATGVLERVGYAWALRRGEHLSREDVTAHRGRKITVTADADHAFRVDADGEVSGPFRSRTWTLEPSAWQVCVPAGD